MQPYVTLIATKTSSSAHSDISDAAVCLDGKSDLLPRGTLLQMMHRYER